MSSLLCEDHLQAVRCLIPGCQHEIFVPQGPLNENNMAFEIRECRFEPPYGTPRIVCELRISVLDLRERISPGQVCGFSAAICLFD